MNVRPHPGPLPQYPPSLKLWRTRRENFRQSHVTAMAPAGSWDHPQHLRLQRDGLGEFGRRFTGRTWLRPGTGALRRFGTVNRVATWAK